MPEVEAEVKVEEEEDLKQEESMLKEEKDQIYQIKFASWPCGELRIETEGCWTKSSAKY